MNCRFTYILLIRVPQILLKPTVHNLRCRYLLQEKFRRSAAFKLLEWRQLYHTDKETLAALHEEPEIYGYFTPVFTMAGSTLKPAYRDVAMLYLHLEHSEYLPHYFIATGNQAKNDTIASLVLDNIIQIEWNHQYVGGPDALEALYGTQIFDKKAIPDHLSGLSIEAIRYAWMLDEPDIKSLSNRLYKFNTTPWDQLKRNDFYSKHSVKEFLFKDSIEGWKEELDQAWRYSKSSEKRGWLAWSRIRRKTNPAVKDPKICKLYISPLIEDLPAVFIRSLPIITNSEAISFKVGSSLDGLLRPDKMVVYFENFESLFETAGLLEKEINSFDPQGVPFSAQLDKDGILSHGVDPWLIDFPERKDNTSWRVIVSNELATAIALSKAAELSWELSIGFLKAKLFSAGIDMDQWRSVN